MTDILQLGNPPIEVVLRRSARARRLSLRVSGIDGKVSMTLPKRASEREAMAFLNEREAWIRSHLEAQRPVVSVEFGTSIPVAGRPRLIHPTGGKRVQVLEDHILVPETKEPGAQLRGVLKTMARDQLAQASEEFATALGRPFHKMTIRDTRSRWGSCTSEGNLMYSWRLILAPPEVLRYVAAHEVAHLQEMNHSRAFWDLVEELMPGHAPHRAWLKREGSGLHRYQFA